MDEYADTFDTDTAPAASPKAVAVNSAPPKSSPRAPRPALTFPGLSKGIELPYAATKPPVTKVDASGEVRDRDTLIITRQHRGILANTERNSAPTEAQMALRDFSAYHPQHVPTWDKNYLNELAYAETSKRLGEERRQKDIAKLNEEEKLELAGRIVNSKGAAEGESFLDRQDNMTKRLEESRANVGLQFEHANMESHLICPACKARQNFEEWRNKVRHCPKDSCKGALFRPVKVWAEVQKSFLDRWVAGIKLGEQRLEKLAKETLPPFRLLTRHVFNKETGEMGEEPIITPPWEDCAEHFFERQQEVIDKIEARKAMAENEAKKASEKIVIAAIKSKPYKFSKPLPDFYARQMASLENKNLSFEDRLAKLQE